MDGSISNRVTTPLHGLPIGAARTAPLREASLGIGNDALRLTSRVGGPGAVDPALAASARRSAETLWATPPAPSAAEPAAGEATAAGEQATAAGHAPAAQGNEAAAASGGAWGGAGAGTRVAQDLADVNDVRFGHVFGAGAATKLDRAVNNLVWHWKLAGFGGADGFAKARTYLDRVSDGFDKEIEALKQSNPRLHARWARVGGPIMALNDVQTAATAVALFKRAQATGDWGPLEDLGRRASHFKAGSAQRDAGEVRAEFAGRATALLAANAPLERQALATLSPAGQAAYAQLGKALGDDPHAKLALQLLALEGKLAPPAGGGQSLLAALNGVATQALAPGIDRRELLASLVRETATPTAITQKEGTWTCTVASAQILTAIERPADYVRIVGGLAAPAGKARLLNGESLQRVAGTEGPDLTGRTVSARLWQAAMMEFSNGSDRYDPKLDLSRRADGSTYRGQVGLEAQQRLFDGATGRAGQVIGKDDVGGDEMAFLAKVKQTLAQGHTVPAAYLVREGVGHAIMITGVADGKVTYADPMGLVKEVPEAEFAHKLITARIDA